MKKGDGIFICYGVLTCLLIGCVIYDIKDNKNKTTDYTYSVQTAHCYKRPIGYKEIYRNVADDVIIFIKDKSTIKTGTKVIINDTLIGDIIETSNKDFIVEVKDPEAIQYGLSNTNVTNLDGDVIGKVSSLEGVGKIRCITNIQ